MSFSSKFLTVALGWSLSLGAFAGSLCYGETEDGTRLQVQTFTQGSMGFVTSVEALVQSPDGAAHLLIINFSDVAQYAQNSTLKNDSAIVLLDSYKDRSDRVSVSFLGRDSFEEEATGKSLMSIYHSKDRPHSKLNNIEIMSYVAHDIVCSLSPED